MLVQGAVFPQIVWVSITKPGLCLRQNIEGDSRLPKATALRLISLSAKNISQSAWHFPFLQEKSGTAWSQKSVSFSLTQSGFGNPCWLRWKENTTWGSKAMPSSSRIGECDLWQSLCGDVGYFLVSSGRFQERHPGATAVWRRNFVPNHSSAFSGWSRAFLTLPRIALPAFCHLSGIALCTPGFVSNWRFKKEPIFFLYGVPNLPCKAFDHVILGMYANSSKRTDVPANFRVEEDARAPGSRTAATLLKGVQGNPLWRTWDWWDVSKAASLGQAALLD